MQHSTIMVDFSPNGRSNFLRKREALAVAIAERQDPLSSDSWGRVRAPKQQRLFSTFAFNARRHARCSRAGLEDSHSDP